MSTHTHLPVLHAYLDALEERLDRDPDERARLDSAQLVHDAALKGLDVAARLLAATDLFEDCDKEHERVRVRLAKLRLLVELRASST